MRPRRARLLALGLAALWPVAAGAGEAIRADLAARDFGARFTAAASALDRDYDVVDSWCTVEAETICNIHGEGGIRVVARAAFDESDPVDRVAVVLTEDNDAADFMRTVGVVMLLLDPDLPQDRRAAMAAEMMREARAGAPLAEVAGQHARYRVLRLDSGWWMIAEANRPQPPRRRQPTAPAW